jgi:hypothetical protein
MICGLLVIGATIPVGEKHPGARDADRMRMPSRIPRIIGKYPVEQDIPFAVYVHGFWILLVSGEKRDP